MMKIKGVHGRNDVEWPEIDFDVVKRTGVKWLKMMSNTSPGVFRRLKEDVPDIQFITRLYHPSFNVGGHLSPQDFFGAMEPVISRLSEYCALYEVHNEPNHHGRIEGWGSTDEDAHSFNAWFLEVYRLLKGKFPEADFGFPGLAVSDYPHRDWQWLGICGPAIARADFFCAHTYWQNFDTEGRHDISKGNHLKREWGLRFEIYRARVPKKVFYVTEAGNSNGQDGYEINDTLMAAELAAWFREVEKYDYVKAACPFILSSPGVWDEQGFTWIKRGVDLKPVVYAIGDL